MINRSPRSGLVLINLIKKVSFNFLLLAERMVPSFGIRYFVIFWYIGPQITEHTPQRQQFITIYYNLSPSFIKRDKYLSTATR